MKKQFMVMAMALVVVMSVASIALGVGMDVIFESSAVSPILVETNGVVHVKVTFYAYGWAAARVWPTFITSDGEVIYFYNIPGWPEICELQYTGGDYETRPSYPDSHAALTIWERDIPVDRLFNAKGPGIYQVMATIRWEPQEGRVPSDQDTQVIGSFVLGSYTEGLTAGLTTGYIAGYDAMEATADVFAADVLVLLNTPEGWRRNAEVVGSYPDIDGAGDIIAILQEPGERQNRK